LVVGQLVIDLRGREARLAGDAVPLTRIEFDLVAYLAAHPGWVVSPDQLMEEVWGYRSMGDTRAVAVHIGNARRKLGDRSDEPRYIQTVRGAGYKLVNPQAAAPPTQRDDARAAPPSGTPAAAAAAPTELEARPDGLVGREHEMTVLAHAWEECRRGHGSIVLLAGDAGIGKTRLAEELAADVELSGGMVAWGRCHDAEGLPAYWPWIQMLRHLIENAPDEELRHDLQEGAEELMAVIPELRQRVPGMPAGEQDGGRTDREQFFRAVTDYLSWSSRRHPLLLILDDLHVADPSSLRLLQAIAPEVSSSPLFIVATYRDTELGPGHPLIGTLKSLEHTWCHRLQIGGLSPGDVERIMSTSTGVVVPPTLARTVHQQTAGNPLFVVELTRLLAVEGHLSGAHPDSVAFSLPLGVRGVLERHIGQLSTGCRDLLGLAALIGRSIDVLVLSEASGLSGEPLLSLLDEAITARLLERESDSGKFRFVHPLVQEALAIDRGEGERLRLHARIGRALEAHSLADPEAFLPDLAYHFSRAAPLGYGPQAYEYSRRAGTGALSRFGYEEAAGHFVRALTLLPCSGLESPTQREEAVGLHEAVGDALSLAARRKHAVDAYQRAAMLLRSDDQATRARLQRKTGAAWLADQEPIRAQGSFESAEATLGPPPASAVGRTRAATSPEDLSWADEKIEITLQRMAAFYFTGDLELLSSLADEANPLVERAGTQRQRGVFASHYLALAFRRERYRVSPQTVAYAREHRRRLHESGDGDLVREAEFQLGFALLWAGELDEAQRHLRKCADLAETSRDHSHLVRALTYLAVLHRLSGEVKQARAQADHAIEQATLAHLPGYVAAGKGTLAWAASRDGDHAGAESHAREALDLWKAPSAFPFEWLARWPLALVAINAGPRRFGEATEHLVQMLDPRQQLLPEVLTAPMAVVVDANRRAERAAAGFAAGADGGLAGGPAYTDESLRGLLQAAVDEATVLNYC
jgi:DNA-binding winged helix-turn-helix (wHTH) protein/tetratricopeptide (TPR) repeat protein